MNDGLASLFGVLWAAVWMTGLFGLVALIHFVLSLPLRRMERARLFLDLVDSALEQGQPVEETLISVAQSRDLSMGVGFHILAAWLEQGLPLIEALAKVPQFLPPQVAAMLQAGRRIGDLRKVLPACRQLLQDSVSQIRGAISYLVILTLVITPIGVFVAGVMKVAVMPKFHEIFTAAENPVSIAGPRFFEFVYHNAGTAITVQAALLLLLWIAAVAYIGGPRIMRWFPFLQLLHFHCVPWRRKRLQRDFSTMLAVLLESGVSEAEAVTLAADCTANYIFRERAADAVENLKQGMKLTEAIHCLDDSGEFRWRLSNAFHGNGGFLRALAGWHEALDAKAFQQEQAASHVITSALVLWTGLFVGAIAISCFTLLISFLNSAILW